MRYLRQSTAGQVVLLGPFVDAADGVTPETTLSIAQANVYIHIHGDADLAAKNDSSGGTHLIHGFYSTTLDASDTATAGILCVAAVVSGARIVYHEFTVLPQQVYDSLIAGSDLLDVGTVAIPAAQLAAALVGSRLTLQRGDDLSLSITGLGAIAAGDTLWFTVKAKTSDADAAALIQVHRTNNLLYINGATPTSASNGSITVNDAAAGNITIAVKAVEMAKLPPRRECEWDVQVKRTGTSVITTLMQGRANIVSDVTLATT